MSARNRTQLLMPWREAGRSSLACEHGRITPATAYTARPKATPGDRTTDTHDRVRTDKIGTTGTVTLRHGGKLHHIGVGREHAGTDILLLDQDLHIRIIGAAAGEPLRELTLDPSRNYQPTGRKPNTVTRRGFTVSSMSWEITQRRVWDSNPRWRVNATAVFKTAAIGH
jgi:hypothetical protein